MIILFSADKQDFRFRDRRGLIWVRFSVEQKKRTLGEHQEIHCTYESSGYKCPNILWEGFTCQEVTPP